MTAIRQQFLRSFLRSRPSAACRSSAVRSLCSSSNAALEHAKLREELEGVKQQMRKLESEHPELRSQREQLEGAMGALKKSNPDLRSQHNAADAFSPPKLHHINIVHQQSASVLLSFYRDVMKMDEMPIELFPRNAQTTEGAGSDVPINFTTDGHMQMHLGISELRTVHIHNLLDR